MLYLLIFALGVVVDQLVKYWAVVYLAAKQTIPIIPKIISFTYAENQGAAFSMLSGARWFFVATAVGFMVLIVFLFKRNYFTTWWSKLGAVLVTAGAVGNGLDRLRLGYVVDMFELKFMNFAIFNVADLLITAGGILTCVYILFVEGKNGKA